MGVLDWLQDTFDPKAQLAGFDEFGRQWDEYWHGPKAPNTAALSAADAAASQQHVANQTQANRPTQVTPFGTTSWTQDANGNWTQNTSLNPADQQNLDASRGLTGGLFSFGQNMLGNQPNWGGLPGISSGDDARNRAEDAIYSRMTSRMDPQWDRRQEALRTQLINQGLDPSSEAAKNAMTDFSTQRNDAYANAMRDAIVGGGAEASRSFGMDLQRHGAALGDIMAQGQYNNALLGNLSGMLRTNTPGMPQMPGFVTAGLPQSPDSLRAAQMGYSNDLARWQGNQDRVTDIVGGVTSLGTSFIPFGFNPHGGGSPYSQTPRLT